MKHSRLPLITCVLVLVFFYLPIIVLVINSFNASRFGGTWEGFSFKWYVRLFHQREIWHALRNTLIIALGATAASAVIGTTAAFALHRYTSRLQRIHYTLIYTPLVVPEILMGMSLLLSFVAVGVKLGLFTIFLAHVTFCISYVTMVVLARLQDFDFSVIEAAQDLGADGHTVFRKVILPLSLSGVISGITMVFVPAVSTFVISKLLSNGTVMLLGDLIEMQFTGAAYNPHLGAAISLIMMVIVIVCMSVMGKFGEGEEQAVVM